MSNRDDFKIEVKRALAARAGHRCSFPGCDAVTIGPSGEGDTATSMSGMACHIAAAAGGSSARRYVKNMSPEERTAIENGVWMCYTHGKLIDADERRFTTPMLKKWREFAESRAQFRQEFGPDMPLPQDKLIDVGFASQELSFYSLGNETNAIGYALLDSCVPLVWGESLCHAVRDILIEIVRNTFQHGSASTCTIQINKRAINITDNGSDFNWLGLSSCKNGRGGQAAVKALIARFGDKLLLGVKRLKNTNLTTISLANSIADLLLVAPCSISVTFDDLHQIRHNEFAPALFSPETANCRIIYLLLPQFLPFSEAFLVSQAVCPELHKDKQFVFVMSQASQGVKEYLLEMFPDSRILNIPNDVCFHDI